MRDDRWLLLGLLGVFACTGEGCRASPTTRTARRDAWKTPSWRRARGAGEPARTPPRRTTRPRHRQENFFKYMAQEFAIDSLVQYDTEPADPTREVPNPARKAAFSLGEGLHAVPLGLLVA